MKARQEFFINVADIYILQAVHIRKGIYESGYTIHMCTRLKEAFRSKYWNTYMSRHFIHIILGTYITIIIQLFKPFVYPCASIVFSDMTLYYVLGRPDGLVSPFPTKWHDLTLQIFG